VPLCEKLFPFACFGLYGGRDIRRIFYHLSSILCTFGLWSLRPLCRLVMMIFWFMILLWGNKYFIIELLEGEFVSF
jgi:hypothetical protein